MWLIGWNAVVENGNGKVEGHGCVQLWQFLGPSFACRLFSSARPSFTRSKEKLRRIYRELRFRIYEHELGNFNRTIPQGLLLSVIRKISIEFFFIYLFDSFQYFLSFIAFISNNWKLVESYSYFFVFSITCSLSFFFTYHKFPNLKKMFDICITSGQKFFYWTDFYLILIFPLQRRQIIRT